MPTTTDAHHAADSAESTTLAALILELDGVAIDTRTVLCEAATAVLRKAGCKLNPGLYARHGIFATVPALAEALVENLEVAGTPAQTVADALTAELDTFLAGKAQLNPSVEKLIKAANQRGLPVAVLTAMPEEQAQAAVERLGLTASGVRLFAIKDDEQDGFPRADIWLKVAKSMGKSARFWVAVTSTQVSAKSALSAGLRCVVVPDSFTSHHDFGGADLVLDSWDDMSANEMLDAVVPMVR